VRRLRHRSFQPRRPRRLCRTHLQQCSQVPARRLPHVSAQRAARRVQL
jgi:hypothetical protein